MNSTPRRPISTEAIDAFKDGWRSTEGYREDKIEGGLLAAMPLLRNDGRTSPAAAEPTDAQVMEAFGDAG